MQCTSKTYPTSFVVTDPKGSILIECGKMLQKFGYRIRFLNTINMKKSMHYNPFAYIHSEKDILKLVTTLIANTKGEGKGGDDFWVKAETLLFTALIGYIHYPEAVTMLLGGEVGTIYPSATERVEEPPKPFVLPPIHSDRKARDHNGKY